MLNKEGVNALKETIIKGSYIYPFANKNAAPSGVILFFELLQIETKDNKKYSAILDLQAGYDMIMGEPIIWFEEIENDLNQKGGEEIYLHQK